MARLNVLIHLQSFLDQSATNNPLQNVWKWSREMASLEGENPTSDSFPVYPNSSQVLFNGFKTLAQDGTTNYSISLKSGNTYILSWVSGTKPQFALARTTTQDNTTQIQVTKNASLLTFSRIAGTALGAASVQPGDIVDISGNFNVLNQGSFKVLAASTNSFTVENPNGVIETVTLSSAANLSFYNLNNVQKENTLRISQGFSLASFGNYTITKVAPDYVEFYSEKALPAETVQTQVSVYEKAKQFIYLETNEAINVILNGGDPIAVQPFVTASGNKPGVFMIKSTVYSLEIQSASLNQASVYLAMIE